MQKEEARGVVGEFGILKLNLLLVFLAKLDAKSQVAS